MIILSHPYGHLVRVLHWCIDQNMTNALEKMDLTAAQGHVMGFLARRETPPCPRDVEEHLELSHPTVSGLLSRLERKGFLELRPDAQDRRCKRIYLLPKGRESLSTMYQTILTNEKQVVADFTPQEQAEFSRYLERAIANMGGNPCPKSTHKEETTK